MLASLAVGMAATGSRSARFEVGSEGLRVRGDFYGRLVPASAIVARGARSVNLRTETALRPARRTLGNSHLAIARAGSASPTARKRSSTSLTKRA